MLGYYCIGALKQKIIVVGVRTDPGPGNFPGLHLADGAVSIAYSHRIQIIATFEPAESKRGMLRVLLPKLVVLRCELLRLARE